MNQNTLIKLEYEELINKIKDNCVCGLGKLLADKVKPHNNIKVIKNRLQETTQAKKILEITNHIPFDGIKDVSLVIDKIKKYDMLIENELVMVSDLLRGCRRLKKFMIEQEFYAPMLSEYAYSMYELKDIEDEIDSKIYNGKIADSATKELSRIRRKIAITESKIKSKLNDFIVSSKNKIYIQEAFVSSRDGRYVIPIKSSYKNKVNGNVVDVSARGTTVYIELKSVAKLNGELAILKLSEQQEEYQIISYLTGLVQESIKEISINVELVSKYDFIFARAKYSDQVSGIEPIINDEGRIDIIEGKHFMLGKECVPLNIRVGDDYKTLVITGPNAGGKTIALKTVGIMTLAMQMGIHVIAKKGTEMAVFDNIFVDIGDNQSIKNSLSTFSSHMKNISDIIAKAGKNTLVLLDEIGVGTEPNEGANLAIAILEELYYLGCSTVVTTHYADIKDFAKRHPEYQNAHMKFDKDTLEPLYTLVIGDGGESNALWISSKMGLKERVIERARKYIKSKDYEYKVVKRAKKKEKDENEELCNTNSQVYNKADRIIILEDDSDAIIYEGPDEFNNYIVYKNKEFREINSKRIKLDISRENLYPKNYDYDSLFTNYVDRKLERDLKRGSKKAVKKIHKEIRKNKEMARNEIDSKKK